MADFFDTPDTFTEDGFLCFYVYQKIDPETSRRSGWLRSIDPEVDFFQYFDGDLSMYEVTDPTIITTPDGLRYERKTWIDTSVTKAMCESRREEFLLEWEQAREELAKEGIELKGPPRLLHRRF